MQYKQPVTFDYNGYIITTDKGLMKTDDIYQWLSQEAYWCKDIPFDTFKTSFDNSYCIGALHGDRQVAYGRLVTDYSVFAYLADVFVREEHRGKGISKKMMQVLFEADWVKGLRGIMLGTRDAHGLYAQFGFHALVGPERFMHITRPNIYEQQKLATQTNTQP